MLSGRNLQSSPLQSPLEGELHVTSHYGEMRHAPSSAGLTEAIMASISEPGTEHPVLAAADGIITYQGWGKWLWTLRQNSSPSKTSKRGTPI